MSSGLGATRGLEVLDPFYTHMSDMIPRPSKIHWFELINHGYKCYIITVPLYPLIHYLRAVFFKISNSISRGVYKTLLYVRFRTVPFLILFGSVDLLEGIVNIALRIFL